MTFQELEEGGICSFSGLSIDGMHKFSKVI
jgi:hypothetical protein